MDGTTHIGPSIHINGEVSAQEPITIDGRVTGTIDASGHPLTVTEAAHIDAKVLAHTIIVCGNVTGRLDAEHCILVKQTATLNGDVRAPALTVTDGARLQGRLEIAGRSRVAQA
jgi:cytoskeletal protein CcmA (bactofilin family)